MHSPSPPADDPAVPIPLQLAAGVQEDLLIATYELERLHQLLAHAGEQLVQQFSEAFSRLEKLAAADGHRLPADAIAALQGELGAAVTSLQFQDLASQSIRHTQQRLRSCADRLARDVMGDDEDGTTLVESEPTRPNPVAQSEMEAGSIELF